MTPETALMPPRPRLFYVHDPMCSWCWGYKPVWERLQQGLAGGIDVHWVVGGLAADSDEPMPLNLRQTIQGHWHRIEAMLGTRFNHEFWTKCTPRRDTYKACRAVIVAEERGHGAAMTGAIQRAYYEQAKNPSDPETLVTLAVELGFDARVFEKKLQSAAVNEALHRDLSLARTLGVTSFPSLRLELDGRIYPVPLDYRDEQVSLLEIQRAVGAGLGEG